MPYKQKGFCPFTKKDLDTPYKDKYGPEKYEYAHGVRSNPTTDVGLSNQLSKSEQRKIQKTIKKEGHFGDIPMELLEGYGPRESHPYRRRVAEINAHHQYLVSRNPNKEALQETLSAIKPENWESRYSDFKGTGDDYDEQGRPRYGKESPEERKARHDSSPDLYGPGTTGYEERMERERKYGL